MKILFLISSICLTMTAHANVYDSLADSIAGREYRIHLASDNTNRCFLFDKDGTLINPSVPDSKCYTGRYIVALASDDLNYCFNADKNGTPFGRSVSPDNCLISPYQK